MDTRTSSSRWAIPAIPSLATVLLVALCWSCPALCGPQTEKAQRPTEEENRRRINAYEINKAAELGEFWKITALLNNTFNPNLVGPLHAAASRGYLEDRDLSTRLASGSSRSIDVKTLLSFFRFHHFAIDYDYQRVAEALLARGADANTRYRGVTPLHEAAWAGSEIMAKVLLAHGAKVNGSDYLGMTPLHVAVVLHEAVSAFFKSAPTDSLAADDANTWLRRYGSVADLLRERGGHE
jgi:hypothetical protein